MKRQGLDKLMQAVADLSKRQCKLVRGRMMYCRRTEPRSKSLNGTNRTAVHIVAVPTLSRAILSESSWELRRLHGSSDCLRRSLVNHPIAEVFFLGFCQWNITDRLHNRLISSVLYRPLIVSANVLSSPITGATRRGAGIGQTPSRSSNLATQDCLVMIGMAQGGRAGPPNASSLEIAVQLCLSCLFSRRSALALPYSAVVTSGR